MADQPDVVDRGKRADGTERKAIKIRPGYVDPALAEKYDAGRRGGKPRGIPGMDPDDPPTQTPTQSQSSDTKSKRRRPKKKAAATGSVDTATKSMEKLAVETPKAEPPSAEKKVKQLKKKLKQIAELEAKDPGELNDEQKDKLSKKADFEAELKEWEAKLSS